MRPIIGITIWKEMKDGHVYESVNEWNIKCIIQNGGTPVLLPITDNDEVIDGYMEMVDGLFFTGGGDINPLTFGEEPIKELGKVEYDRDEFEIKLYNKAVLKNIPILGICRGMQLMNVASGGTIYQDIYKQRPETKGHSPRIAFDGNEYHSIDIKQDSILHKMLNTTEIRTNSYHHQAVKDVASNYTPTAFSKDGIIECIESTNLKFAIGIQWHPEVMAEKYPIFNNIFKTFVDTCIN